jgi:hypothetical protein
MQATAGNRLGALFGAVERSKVFVLAAEKNASPQFGSSVSRIAPVR